FFQVNDHLEPLFVIKGSCFGFEVCLDKAHLTFGAVVQDCKCNLKTTLLNTGDIGSRFRWEYKSIDNIFTITPSAGYCSPGTSAVFCKLENYDKIILTLSGSCVSLPEPNEVISFGTNVREVEKKVISLQNSTVFVARLFLLVVDNTGNDFIVRQYLMARIFNITFEPVLNVFLGSVLFKLPDGQGLLYDLLGIAESPLPNEKKNLEIPTKAAHTEYLTVKNWLQIAQRLKVVTELVKADRSDAPYTLRGTQFITVPGSSERNYKFIIEVYKECNLIFKVMFVNEDGGEYQYYDLFIKVVKCGPIDIINLNTSVRIPVKYELVLENPLGTEVTFDISCVSSEITFQSPCLALPNSMKYINLKYLPLQQGDSICQLDISSTELGSYSYELNLKAGPPPDEKPIHFTANLGSQCTELAHFKNLTKNKAEFICNDCHVVISLPKSIEFISFPVTGKLVITCTDEMLSEFSWVYYLKGIA
ncbi:Hydrocephalus-inducing protein, partial [Blattella germanica]